MKIKRAIDCILQSCREEMGPSDKELRVPPIEGHTGSIPIAAASLGNPYVDILMNLYVRAERSDAGCGA